MRCLEGLFTDEKFEVKSGPSTVSTIVVMKNETDSVIQTCWIDYEGNEADYALLPPRKSYEQQTYLAHPWLFRDAVTSERLVVGRKIVVYPEKPAKCEMVVTRAQKLFWNKSNHSKFPEEFRSVVQTLLLCCYRTSCRQSTQAEGSPTHSDWLNLLSSFVFKDEFERPSSFAMNLASLPPDILVHVIKFIHPYIYDVDMTP